MRAFLFCTSYFESAEQFDARYRKWLQYHASIPLEVEKLFVIDDASPKPPTNPQIAWLDALPDALPEQRVIGYHFTERLGRPSLLNYPGWWRSFFSSVRIADRYGFRKIIHVESDTFLLSKKLTDWMNGVSSGWSALWCPRYQFPETCVQVICADQFPAMREIAAKDYATHYALQPVEVLLPFTHVEKNFGGNRYNEFRSSIPGYADYAAQCLPQTPVEFRA